MIEGETRILLYGHGGSLNRGCEAIVRGTVATIKKHMPNACIRLLSSDPDSDKKALNDLDLEIERVYDAPEKSFGRMVYKVLNKLNIMEKAASFSRFCRNSGFASDTDIAFSIGGDNYCYNYLSYFFYMNRMLRKKGVRNILWGCSLNPEDVRANGDIRSTLRLFDIIVARESITYNVLKEEGFGQNLYLVPDPAFLLDVEAVELPQEWKHGKTIGMNISPLILDYGADSGFIGHMEDCIGRILQETDCSIALIPHVTSEPYNDHELLRVLNKRFADEKRIILVSGDLSAGQYKGLIAACKVFIGARTHSVIAAYSTGVPALALGYSIKAKGIADDLIGPDDNWVVSVKDIGSGSELADRILELIEKKNEVHKRINGNLPAYSEPIRDIPADLKEAMFRRGNNE